MGEKLAVKTITAPKKATTKQPISVKEKLVAGMCFFAERNMRRIKSVSKIKNKTVIKNIFIFKDPIGNHPSSRIIMPQLPNPNA